jgi:hypothetical protein
MRLQFTGAQLLLTQYTDVASRRDEGKKEERKERREKRRAANEAIRSSATSEILKLRGSDFPLSNLSPPNGRESVII